MSEHSLGDIYVLIRPEVPYQHSIKRFDAQGLLKSTLLTFPEKTYVYTIAIDDHDIIYTPYRWDDYQIIIKRFTSEGTELPPPILDRDLYSDRHLYDIQVDAPGNIFMVDGLSFVKYDQAGNRLFQIKGTEPGIGIGQIRPYGLDVDEQGNVWVADTYNHRIIFFGNDGSFKFQFGTQGLGPGEFQLPQDVAVAGGRIFVSDTYNQLQPAGTDFYPGPASVVDAGENVTLTSENLAFTVLGGKASDPGGHSMVYRWLEDTAPLSDW